MPEETFERLTVKDAGGQASPFHAYRIQFNTAFLNEDFAAAGIACDQALLLQDLLPTEREELVRFLLMLGRIGKALELINGILGVDPDQHQIALHKARILRLQMPPQEYRDFLDARLRQYPDHAPYYHDYLEFLEANPDPDALVYLCALAASHGVAINQKPAAPVPEGAPEEFAQAMPIHSDAALLTMLELFQGRENCHARQWVDDSGKYGYSLVNEPINVNTLRNHLLGTHTIGVYQLDLANRVKWIVFDIDLDKSHLDDLHDQDFRLWLEKGFQKVIADFRSLLGAFHLKMNVEFSGYKGYHIWILLQEKVSAGFARVLAQRLAAQVNLENLPLKIEIFPKQVKLASGNYGNLIKLPYGIHRLSGLPSSMLDEEGKLISFNEFIANPLMVTAAEFISALYSLDPSFDLAAGLAKVQEDEPTSSLPQVSENYDPESEPEWLCLKQNCHALWTVDNLIKTNGSLSNEQKNILKFTCGYLKQGPQVVNALLRQLSNQEPQDLMKSSFKGNAMSCSKIRSYLAPLVSPELCCCDFSSAGGAYPTPLLHLRKLGQQVSSSASWNDLKLKEMVSTYLKLKREDQELGARLSQTEQDLLAAFEETGVSEFISPYGILKKQSDSTGDHLVLILK